MQTFLAGVLVTDFCEKAVPSFKKTIESAGSSSNFFFLVTG
jgi:hypothetical protein